MTDIHYMKSTCLFLCLILSASLSLPLIADELTDRQYSVTEARKKYDLEKTRYEDATMLVNAQKQRVAEDQALLKSRQKQQAVAKASMDKAKAKLDKANRQLKQTWKKGQH